MNFRQIVYRIFLSLQKYVLSLNILMRPKIILILKFQELWILVYSFRV